MAGTHEGRVIIFPQLTEQLTPFEDKPQAKKLIDADGGEPYPHGACRRAVVA